MSEVKVVSKVAHAVAHNLIHHPATGQFGPALSSTPGAAMKDMKLDLVSVNESLFVRVTIKKIDILVPLQNISHFVLEK